jgi:creatinine amidohydrolase
MIASKKIGLLASFAFAVLAANLVPNPSLTAPLSSVVEIKDLTWVEVKAAIQAGHTTVIVPTGGIEQNGPHMILGKHDYIVGWAASQIAKGVGHTLVAPVLSYVPQGSYEPASGHLKFAGTLGLPEPVYGQVLEGIARSLKAGGRTVVKGVGERRCARRASRCLLR